MRVEELDEEERRNDRVESWKEIASYLHCSIRTAQRRAKRGMPVHRHEATGSVWAYRSQLDAWFKSLSRIEADPAEQTPKTAVAADSPSDGAANLDLEPPSDAMIPGQ